MATRAAQIAALAVTPAMRKIALEGTFFGFCIRNGMEPEEVYTLQHFLS